MARLFMSISTALILLFLTLASGTGLLVFGKQFPYNLYDTAVFMFTGCGLALVLTVVQARRIFRQLKKNEAL
ncbi:hypothetical protein NEX54_003858 [Escherichia coli]|uniref:hypothetical protein n=1 Tax=Klebsiella TaxID=570 RepID=UPI0027EFAFF6|nr:hypothetical protein [Klebsiella pneumoniae]EBG0206282.1 hypothetical protein [Salmonella enterica subsp. enterica serovar Ajiobo]EHG0245970.1 hypothetical protein [Salmonella enterica subsp. enterica serovar Newport]EHV1668346.1 hypothetical protein [Salmonella enterica]EJI4171218.1 hypothetical protein [Escherichia coli]HBN4195360.1 hypothetical protein [Escherichia coli O25b:H4-ST131]HDU5805040.1 hypothetical protein [Klebsiella aerogenes]